jgi:uncharacterized membrane protein YdjX (TVP38/TMEM64 family)
MTGTARRVASLAALLLTILALASWSYRGQGLVFALVEATRGSGQSLEILREYLARWGAFAPVAYLLLVVVEVLVAPLPGTLLYAPGGALFGGFVGGSLSLAGNVIGAWLACLIARFWGEPVRRALDSPRFAAMLNTLADRALWLILLLRMNPLTSSDLVSYAAGLVGVPVWKVVVGTLVGMAPLCYAQAYVADRLFSVMPGSLWIVVAMGVAYAAAIIWLLVGFRARGTR